ncbi:putative hydrolase [Sphingomonas changbaiensis NBRC 104936]|uniref:Putative hydrolase n=1 Tax=Sphingomonas changbaiensis NBRC 104936 TaxID=1219043 RepID=A0A0E9MRK3_9SPHN|nr:alpha/beta hydrolase [Sphingomonas changbaiensis]GAO39775.1 putative hydrolase [Sphingomonas changbaiensis NBRC 104936]
MTLQQQRFHLPTGVELDVTMGGPRGGEALIFLHGFPESHRTWRHQLAALSDTCFVVAPDQRGYAGSSKPPRIEDYEPSKPVADLIALADALELERFTLVGHDWGGAIAWLAALKHPDRIARLVIANAPHPFIFQRTLIDDPEQRAASQYIRTFREPAFETKLGAMGLEKFFEINFIRSTDAKLLSEEEKAVYLDQWRTPGAFTAMLNWYRASSILVPKPDETVERPPYLEAPFPTLRMPALVIWGMRDRSLLPVQLDGLSAFVDDLTVIEVDTGHFVTWEAPETVTAAIREFLRDKPLAEPMRAGEMV